MKLKEVKNVGCKCVILESNEEAIGLSDIVKYLECEVTMEGSHCVLVHDKKEVKK